MSPFHFLPHFYVPNSAFIVFCLILPFLILLYSSTFCILPHSTFLILHSSTQHPPRTCIIPHSIPPRFYTLHHSVSIHILHSSTFDVSLPSTLEHLVHIWYPHYHRIHTLLAQWQFYSRFYMMFIYWIADQYRGSYWRNDSSISAG